VAPLRDDDDAGGRTPLAPRHPEPAARSEPVGDRLELPAWFAEAGLELRDADRPSLLPCPAGDGTAVERVEDRDEPRAFDGLDSQVAALRLGAGAAGG
jgi:hypothetical protein